MRIKEFITDLLDVTALLLIASGVAAYVYQWIGWLCLVVAGTIVLAGSLLAAKVNGKEGDDG